MSRTIYFRLLLSFILSVSAFWGMAQQPTKSTNGVKYQVKFDAATQLFTVYVVPQYNTPNANNSATSEFGSTAQVSLKVPSNFVIGNITNVNGDWQNTPTKLGPAFQSQLAGQGLPADTAYYAIGKGFSETNYGTFTSGVPVPLFTFTSTAKLGDVSILLDNHPFIAVADAQLSLNVGSSFYSRSGQPAGGNVVPLEQFSGMSGLAANFIEANNDTQAATPGLGSTLNVLANDIFNGITPLIGDVNMTILGTPTNGTAVVNPDGTITFTPTVGFTGTASYTYQICDKENPTVCETATVTVTVTCTAPSAPTTSPLTLCQGVTANPLTATPASGTTLRWYTAATGGTFATSITPSTTTAGPTNYYVSSYNTTTGCESSRTLLVVTVTAAPAAPVQGTNGPYCVGETASPVSATPAGGATLLWYSAATGGVGSATAPTPTTTTQGTQTFYVSSFVSGGCESTRTMITVTVNDLPIPPSVSPTGAYCVGDGATALSATPPSGSTVRWYTVATGGTPIATPTPSTATATTLTYYAASVSASGCESATRSSITITVNEKPAAPIVTTPVRFCLNETPTALSATPAAGTSLRWYLSSTSTTSFTTQPSISTATPGTTSYFVTSFNTVTGCESPRVEIQVIVNNPPTAPTVSPLTLCQGVTANPLTATPASGTTLRWYTAATGGTFVTTLTPSTATLGTTNYYVSSYNTTTGCESTRTLLAVTITAAPAAPIAGTNGPYCVGQTASPVSATPASGATLLWYSAATGGVGGTTAPTPTTTAQGTQTFYVSSSVAGGCESTRTAITVTINELPIAPSVSPTGAYCVGENANTLTATPPSGATLRWYNAAGTLLAGAPTPSTATAGTTTYFVASVSASGCESATRSSITITVNATPAAPIVTSPLPLCQGTTASPLTATPAAGTTLRWYSDAAGTIQISTPTPSTATATTLSYYARSINTTTSCQSPVVRLDVIINAPPTAPIVTTPVTLCQGASANALTATPASGTTLRWYETATGGTSNTVAPTPSTATVGTINYYVSSLNISTGCESPRTLLAVEVASCRVVFALNDNMVTTVGTTGTGNVLTNDDINDGIAPLVVSTTLVTPATNGTVTLLANGTYTYVPNAGFVGNDTFRYRVCDSGTPAACDEAEVKVNITASPLTSGTTPPVVLNDNYSMTKGGTLNGNVLTNDLPTNENGVLTASVVTPPSVGTLNLASNGTFTYTPPVGFVGEVTYVYQACDNRTTPLCAPATVQIIVKDQPAIGVNLPPVATDDFLTVFPGVAKSVNVLTNDTDPEGTTLSISTTPLIAPTKGNATITAAGLVTYTPNANATGADFLTYSVCDAGNPQECSQATLYFQILPGEVKLSAKVYLQGALLGVPSTDVLMRDDLRVKSLIPLQHPYGTQTPLTVITAPTSAVFNVTGANAIVDWVFIELRSGTNSATVVDSRPAFVQRDGDIVDTDGISPVLFKSATPGSYFIVVKHRNHLGVMSGTPVIMTSTATVIDFRSASTNVFVPIVTPINQAQVEVSQGRAMWTGNVLFDDRIIYQGPQTDAGAIYSRIIGDVVRNPLQSSSYKIKGYDIGDLNMNGETVFQGPGNDIEFIYLNVIKNHNGNATKQNSFVVKEQVPSAL